MKTKSGIELLILGQIQIDGKQHYIVQMPNAFYQHGLLVRHVVLPMHYFDVDNGISPAEIVT